MIKQTCESRGAIDLIKYVEGRWSEEICEVYQATCERVVFMLERVVYHYFSLLVHLNNMPYFRDIRTALFCAWDDGDLDDE